MKHLFGSLTTAQMLNILPLKYIIKLYYHYSIFTFQNKTKNNLLTQIK